MLRTKAVRRGFQYLVLALIFSSPSSVCLAATIGQWSGNSSIWASSGNFSTIYAALTTTAPGGPGYTVTSGHAITMANLKQNNFYVVTGSAATMTALEVKTLTKWVRAGGILLLFAAGDTNQVAAANAVLGRLGPGDSGSALSVAAQAQAADSNGIFTGGALYSRDLAVAGPHNITYDPLSWYQANVINGGSSMAMNVGEAYNLSQALRMDRFALGKVYVFGDRFDSNSLIAAGGNSNLQLFLNLLAQSNSTSRAPFGATPEPSTLLLTGLGIAAVLFCNRYLNYTTKF